MDLNLRRSIRITGKFSRSDRTRLASGILLIVLLQAIILTGSIGIVSGETDVYLNVKKTEVRKIDLAVPLFAVDSDDPEIRKATEKIKDILINDLRMSGVFNAVDISQFYQSSGASEGEINFNQWYLVGMQALLVGKYEEKKNKVTLKAWLYDVPMGQLIIGKAYRGPKDSLREIAHRLSDEVVYRFTGDRGVAATKISYVSDKTGNKEIYLADADGENVRILTRNESLNLSPAFSPDGEHIVYTSYVKDNPDLFMLDIESGKSEQLISGGLNITPDFSPDGKKIAFSRSFEGNPDIYILELKTKNLKRLTFYEGIDCSPSWSPNNREIVFISDRSGSPQLWLMDAEGGNLRRLTHLGSYNDAPSWSPKGDKIVFQARVDGLFDIFTIQPDGNRLLRLTGDEGNNENPTWAPDGRHIVFSSTRMGGINLFIMDVVSGTTIRITENEGRCTSPVWSK